MKKISFIIPTLNEEKVIEKTLQNLSTYLGEKEIIVSDGKSSDRTVEMSKKYTDSVIVYSKEERQTIADGRNIGAEMANGDFLVFLDADIHIPNINIFFTKAINIFEKNENCVALIPSIRVFRELETFGDMVVFSSMDLVHTILNNMLKIGGAPGEFQMIKTEAFRRVGGYNKKLIAGEDHELLRRLSKIGNVYFERKLRIYHPGRRAHKIGWPRLLWKWLMNGVSYMFFKRSSSKEWEEIR